MNHATVTIGEFTIPLIGVPKAAGEDKCDDCGKIFSIQELEFDGRFHCRACRQRKFNRQFEEWQGDSDGTVGVD